MLRHHVPEKQNWGSVWDGRQIPDVARDQRGCPAKCWSLTDADLMDGEVTVAVEHSTVNYKTNHRPAVCMR